jgi:hypothetical protein
MSVRFRSVDTNVAKSTKSPVSMSNDSFLQLSGQHYHMDSNMEDNVDDFNSMSSDAKATTQALMNSDQQHHHQMGWLKIGTPDALNASCLSSDYSITNNNNNNFNNNNNVNNNNINNINNASSQTAPQLNPSAQDLFSKLNEALALEPKYQPNLFLPQQSNVSIIFPSYLFFFSFRILTSSLICASKNLLISSMLMFLFFLLLIGRRNHNRD